MINYKLKDFFRLPYYEQLHYYNSLRYVKGLNKIGEFECESLGMLKYGDILMLKKNINEDTIKAFELVFGISKETLFECTVKEYFPAFNWIRDSFGLLLENEKNYLQGKADPKMKAAGIDEFDILGDMNVLVPLSKDYSCDPDMIAGWSYNKVFSILLYNKIDADFNKRYAELK